MSSPADAATQLSDDDRLLNELNKKGRDCHRRLPKVEKMLQVLTSMEARNVPRDCASRVHMCTSPLEERKQHLEELYDCVMKGRKLLFAPNWGEPET